MGKIRNFHLPATNTERAAAFYRGVFGWEFTQHAAATTPYLIGRDTNGAEAGVDIAITQRSPAMQAPVPTIEVHGIDDAMARLSLHGGEQSHVVTIAGIGRFGYARDCEGNVIALLEPEAPGTPAPV